MNNYENAPIHSGKIIQIPGPVIDVVFEKGDLPKIKEKLTVSLDGEVRTMEVVQHVNDRTARCVMLGVSEGLARNLTVESTGGPIRVPVGEAVLGRVLNVLGEPIDGGEPKRHHFLLTTFANGAFCGGGFHSNPNASLCDGRIDVVEIENVSRTRFLTLVGHYKKGTHTQEKLSRFVHFAKREQIDIVFDAPMIVSLDGELSRLDEMHLSVAHGALRLRVPKGAEPVGKPLVKEEQEVLA